MTALADYARVPIVFTVDRVLDVTTRHDGPERFALSERRLDARYVKDYDAITGDGPLQWARHYDLSNWALFSARLAGRLVGGAAVAFDTPEFTMLEGRRDLAVRWDIRVSPDVRRHGVGTALFENSRGMGAAARVSATEDRNSEHQRARMPVLRAAGLPAAGDRSRGVS